MLASNLYLRANVRATALFTALSARGYTGDLTVLQARPSWSARNLALIAGSGALLLAVALGVRLGWLPGLPAGLTGAAADAGGPRRRPQPRPLPPRRPPRAEPAVRARAQDPPRPPVVAVLPRGVGGRRAAGARASVCEGPTGQRPADGLTPARAPGRAPARNGSTGFRPPAPRPVLPDPSVATHTGRSDEARGATRSRPAEPFGTVPSR